MNVQTPTLDSAGRRLVNAGRAFLPTQTESGVSAAQLNQSCDQYLSSVGTGSPSANPYADMPTDQAVDATRNIKQYATGMQAVFTAGPITVGQLKNVAEQVQADAQSKADEAAEARAELKGAYRGKVVKTGLWMGATMCTLVLGGLLPNPITGLMIAGAGAMAIRSLGQARSAQKELQQRLPAIEDQLKTNTQLAQDASFYAPLLGGWDDLLKRQPEGKVA